MKKVVFKMGGVFPSDNPVALWIIGLSMLTNDLDIVSLYFHEAIKAYKSGDAKSLPKIFYFVWLISSHLYEALEFLRYADRVSEINEFITILPYDTQQRYAHLKSEWSSSFVKKKVCRLRNSFFHYPSLNHPKYQKSENQFRAVLDKIKNKKVCFVINQAFPQVYAEFAGVVRNRLGFGDRVENVQLFREVNQRLVELTKTLISFVKESRSVYFSRVPKSVLQIEEKE